MPGVKRGAFVPQLYHPWLIRRGGSDGGGRVITAIHRRLGLCYDDVMNEYVHPRSVRNSTQAAEGLPRWRWTVADIRKAIEAGILDSDDPFELIGGEIVPMAAKGNRHSRVCAELMMHWGGKRPGHIKFGAEAPIELSEIDWPEPDFLFHPAAITLDVLTGTSVSLIVEVSDSSVYKDLNLKASRYAQFGVREYWVINARSLRTTVHKLPAADGFGSITERSPSEMLVPELVPDMSVRLSDLDLA